MTRKTLSTKLAMRYNRQVSLPGFDIDGQEALLNSRVLIIGVGGLGCAAAQYLVAAGVGTITLVDDDCVEITNLQRQVLHHENNVGKNKCLSAEEVLSAMNSHTTIQAITERLSDDALSEQVQHHDLVMDCTDNLETRNQINRICVNAKKPLITGAAIRMEGQLSVYDPRQQCACYACISYLMGEQNLSCVEAGVMSPVVGIVGAMQALEGIKVLTDYGNPLTGKLMLFDGLSAQWRTLNVSKRDTCEVCSAV